MKYADMLGYGITKKVAPGKWEEVIEERKYFGDILYLNRRTQNGETINDNLLLDIRISIVADPFAKQNINRIKYAIYNGSRWKVTSVEVAYPRLILSLGGIYNGPTPEENK